MLFVLGHWFWSEIGGRLSHSLQQRLSVTSLAHSVSGDKGFDFNLCAAGDTQVALGITLQTPRALHRRTLAKYLKRLSMHTTSMCVQCEHPTKGVLFVLVLPIGLLVHAANSTRGLLRLDRAQFDVGGA